MLVGPSGCGKSTLLRLIAGLEEITDGELYIGDRLVNDVPPKDRDIAMVFQNYALYPHMTVYKNMAFGLENRKVPKKEIKERVFSVAKILDIEDLLGRKPKAMSGGQRQRVALGRAMVREPEVFLLDEPLSNLDAKLRTSMRTEIVKLHNRLATTFVYVTHDQIEAMTMGDRIVVMRDGVIQQVGTPQQLYDYPLNQFVAGFIGTPKMNFLDVYVKQDGDRLYLSMCNDNEQSIYIDKDDIDLTDYINKTLVLGIRPEHIIVSESGYISGDIEVVENLGSESYMYLNCMGNQVIVRIMGSTCMNVGEEVHLTFKQSHIHLFKKECGTAII